MAGGPEKRNGGDSVLTGRAFKFGDNVSTDHIIPGRYTYLRSNRPELAKHVMEDADTTFASRVKPPKRSPASRKP